MISGVVNNLFQSAITNNQSFITQAIVNAIKNQCFTTSALKDKLSISSTCPSPNCTSKITPPLIQNTLTLLTIPPVPLTLSISNDSININSIHIQVNQVNLSGPINIAIPSLSYQICRTDGKSFICIEKPLSISFQLVITIPSITIQNLGLFFDVKVAGIDIKTNPSITNIGLTLTNVNIFVSVNNQFTSISNFCDQKTTNFILQANVLSFDTISVSQDNTPFNLVTNLLTFYLKNNNSSLLSLVSTYLNNALQNSNIQEKAVSVVNNILYQEAGKFFCH